jgi:hypothetical protein
MWRGTIDQDLELGQVGDDFIIVCIRIRSLVHCPATSRLTRPKPPTHEKKHPLTNILFTTTSHRIFVQASPKLPKITLLEKHILVEKVEVRKNLDRFYGERRAAVVKNPLRVCLKVVPTVLYHELRVSGAATFLRLKVLLSGPQVMKYKYIN